MNRTGERFASWANAPASPRQAYAIAALVGFALYLIVYGPAYFVGTSSYWDLPTNDARAYLMGYRYFLHEPWHWPLFVTHTMNVPYPKSIAFTDSIPLWALIHKAIATLITPWRSFSERAYLGLWYALCHILQPVLGVAILRQLGKTSRLATITTALLFIAIPAWTFRYFHASLFAQWIPLWALRLYLKTPNGEPAPRRLRLVQLVQLGIAALINPYHTVMSLGIFAASVLRSRRWRSALVWLPAGFAAIGFAAWFGNYFSKDAKISLFGFEVASANVLGPFIPRHGLAGDAIWIDPTGYQYEGLVYFGLGFLILLALFLPRLGGVPAQIKRHAFLFAVALGAWLLSLSTQVYAGPYHVLGVPLPGALHWIADQFRCPGRFVWLPMYVLMIVLLSSALGRFTRGWQLAIVPVLAVLQLLDACDNWAAYREQTREAQVGPLPIAPIRELIAQHDSVALWPAFDCLLDGTPGVDTTSLELQFLTSERALPINGVYSARPTRDCAEDRDRIAALEPADRTLYLMFHREDRVADRLATDGATCGELAFGRLCSKVPGAIDKLIAQNVLHPVPPPANLPKLAYGEKLELGSEASTAFLDADWSFPFNGRRWTDGAAGSLLFAMTGTKPHKPALYVQGSTLNCGRRHGNSIEVRLSNESLGTLQFDPSHNDPTEVHILPIEHPESLDRPSVSIAFHPRDYRSLVAVKCNGDPRQLGIEVERLWIDEAPAQ